MTDDERVARELARHLATPEGQAAMKEAAERSRKRQEEFGRQQRKAFEEAWEQGNKPRRWWTGR